MVLRAGHRPRPIAVFRHSGSAAASSVKEGAALVVRGVCVAGAAHYRGRGSTFDRARVIQTIYDASAPIPGPALDTRSEQFLREVRLLVHEAVLEGGGELVSDVLGQAAA